MGLRAIIIALLYLVVLGDELRDASFESPVGGLAEQLLPPIHSMEQAYRDWFALDDVDQPEGAGATAAQCFAVVAAAISETSVAASMSVSPAAATAVVVVAASATASFKKHKKEQKNMRDGYALKIEALDCETENNPPYD